MNDACGRGDAIGIFKNQFGIDLAIQSPEFFEEPKKTAPRAEALCLSGAAAFY
ncbi:hypothetical protein [Alcaligenes sp. Marseille-Q7550]